MNIRESYTEATNFASVTIGQIFRFARGNYPEVCTVKQNALFRKVSDTECEMVWSAKQPPPDNPEPLEIVSYDDWFENNSPSHNFTVYDNEKLAA